MANAKLESKVISDFSFHMEPVEKEFQVGISATSEHRKPIDENDNSGVMCFTVKIESEDKKTFALSVTEQMLFRFDEKPEDFNAVMKKAMVEIGIQVLSDDIDRLLSSMDKPPVVIKDKIQIQ